MRVRGVCRAGRLPVARSAVSRDGQRHRQPAGRHARRDAPSTGTPSATENHYTDSQPRNWVSTPPSSTPPPKLAAPIAAYRQNARLRAGPASNTSVTRASAAGPDSAAPMPWAARAPSSPPPGVRRQRPGRREHGEQGDPEGEHPPPAQHIGQPTTHQQEARERDGVRGHDPLERGVRQAETRSDGRQRGVEHPESTHVQRERPGHPPAPRPAGATASHDGGHPRTPWNSLPTTDDDRANADRWFEVAIASSLQGDPHVLHPASA